jgi:DNA-binding CsgD family transcriptional regulator
MSRWGVELVIGKLLTDEALRQRFERAGRKCLAMLREQGIDLNEREVAAFLATDKQLWSDMARRIERLPADASTPPGAAAPAMYPVLTPLERQVLRGVVAGLTNKQIAVEVRASEMAVKATLQRLFRKTRVRTRGRLVRLVLEGLLGADVR